MVEEDWSWLPNAPVPMEYDNNRTNRGIHSHRSKYPNITPIHVFTYSPTAYMHTSWVLQGIETPAVFGGHEV